MITLWKTQLVKHTIFISVYFALSIQNEHQRGDVSASSLSRTTGKLSLTHLSKEPYITFSVRTTSPTTVCRYSSGTLEGKRKMSNTDVDKRLDKSNAHQIFGLTTGSHEEKHFRGFCFVCTWVFLKNQTPKHE